MRTTAAILACSVLAFSAHADVLDLSGLQSWDLDGDSSNETRIFHPTGGAPFNVILTIDYDITIETVGASWLSEVVIRFGNSDGTFHGVWPDTFTPGVGNDIAGTARFTGSFQTDIHLNPDGEFHVSLFESFDDTADAVDAVLLDGSTMTLGYFIPAPSSAMLLGLSGMLATRRRR